MAHLAERLQHSDRLALRAQSKAREAARTLATDSEKKEDGWAAIDYGSLATGQAARARRFQEELGVLIAFREAEVPRFERCGPVALGAIVEVRTEDETGYDERAFFLLPVGAGTELSGSGGWLPLRHHPASSVDRALMGRRTGDSVEVTLAGEVHK